MPLPESSFITAAQRLIQESGPSSTLRQGDLAQKLEALKQARAHEFEPKIIAVLEARYEAMQKIAEENAKKKKEQEEKKAQLAEARKKEAEEKERRRNMIKN